MAKKNRELEQFISSFSFSANKMKLRKATVTTKNGEQQDITKRVKKRGK